MGSEIIPNDIDLPKVPVKRGYKYALEMTLKIAKALPNKQDKKLYKKTVHSIFDDMLQENTTFNRRQRRNMVTELDQRLKELLK